jgi:hypothetical protein
MITKFAVPHAVVPAVKKFDLADTTVVPAAQNSFTADTTIM